MSSEDNSGLAFGDRRLWRLWVNITFLKPILLFEVCFKIDLNLH